MSENIVILLGIGLDKPSLTSIYTLLKHYVPQRKMQAQLNRQNAF